MCPKKVTPHAQAQLPLSKNTLWQQLPEPTRQRCRQLLIQLIQHVVRTTLPERSNDERQN
jgi:hypothetical protein